MNLHVNLILESEMRSSSRISRSFFIKVSSAVAAVLFLALIMVVLVGARSAKNSFLFAEQEKNQLDPVFRTVFDLNQELVAIQDLTNAIAVWSLSRPDWPDLLLGIQSAAPANIQLTRFTANESISMIEAAPTRVVTLYFQGKADGKYSETDVQEMEKSLKEKAPFIGIMETAQVKQFEAIKTIGQENMRMFDIECRFKARKLYQPPARGKPKAAK
jgi:hypothetical protein